MARKKRLFSVRLEVDIELELDAAVVGPRQVKWFKRDIDSGASGPEDIVKHVAFNMVLNNLELPSIDGVANFPAKYARIVNRWVETEVSANGRDE